MGGGTHGVCGNERALAGVGRRATQPRRRRTREDQPRQSATAGASPNMAPPPRSTIFRPVLATTSLTTSKGSPWQGSRTKLRPRDVPVFQGAAPQLFTEVATAVCDAKCLPRKELFEAWEVATRVDAKFPGVQRVADLAAGHGLLGYLLLILASSRGNLQRTAVCVDQRMPPSFDTLTDALSQRWPDLRDRMQYVEDDLANVETDPSVLVTSVHACGPLTDSVLERAVAGGAHAVAVMPCCHSLRKQPIPPVVGLDAQLLRARADALGSAPDAIDFARIEALRLCGYEVDEPSAEIDPTVTPYNRLIIATRRGSPAPPRQQADVCEPAALAACHRRCRPGARTRAAARLPMRLSLLPLADGGGRSAGAPPVVPRDRAGTTRRSGPISMRPPSRSWRAARPPPRGAACRPAGEETPAARRRRRRSGLGVLERSGGGGGGADGRQICGGRRSNPARPRRAALTTLA